MIIRIWFENVSQKRYPKEISHLSLCIHIYPGRYPYNLSRLISKTVIQLYPIIFFISKTFIKIHIQLFIQLRYHIHIPLYPLRYPYFIFDIHIDICLIYPHNNPILSYFIQTIYIFRYPYSIPSTISHYIRTYPSLSE